MTAMYRNVRRTGSPSPGLTSKNRRTRENMQSPQFTSVCASLRLGPYASASALSGSRSPEGRGPHRLFDVFVLLLGDDVVQRHQTADSIAVHQPAWRGQSAVRPARLGLHHRHPDDRLRLADGAPAATLG